MKYQIERMFELVDFPIKTFKSLEMDLFELKLNKFKVLAWANVYLKRVEEALQALHSKQYIDYFHQKDLFLLLVELVLQKQLSGFERDLYSRLFQKSYLDLYENYEGGQPVSDDEWEALEDVFEEHIEMTNKLLKELANE